MMNSSHAADETAAVCFGSVYMVITVCVRTPLVKIQMLCNIPLRWRSFEELHSVGSCCSSSTEYIYETSVVVADYCSFSNSSSQYARNHENEQWLERLLCNGKVYLEVVAGQKYL
mmetsp:Transcript_29218/g.49816  ORF Transcript_29218/g.49816 Transcript_29218/m.49816 type:complete len:115 (+) Transcript_29218:585-929(+)